MAVKDTNSIRQQAIANGIRPGTVYNRIHNLGWPADKAVSVSIQPRIQIPRGVVDPSTVRRRVANGWSMERATSVKSGENVYAKYEYKDNLYSTNDLSKLSGIPMEIISHRINSLGWNVTRATEQPVQKRGSRRVIHKKYESNRLYVTLFVSKDGVQTKKTARLVVTCGACNEVVGPSITDDITFTCPKCNIVSHLRTLRT